VVGEVLDEDVVDGDPGSRRRRRRRRAVAGRRALGAAGGDDEDRASRNRHDGERLQIPREAPCLRAGPAWRSHGCSFAPRYRSAPAGTPPGSALVPPDKRAACDAGDAITEVSILYLGS